jgi:hypothetical protein
MGVGEGVRGRGQGSMTPGPLPRITFFNNLLVLTDRKAHCEALVDLLADHGVDAACSPGH